MAPSVCMFTQHHSFAFVNSRGRDTVDRIMTHEGLNQSTGAKLDGTDYHEKNSYCIASSIVFVQIPDNLSNQQSMAHL